MAEISQISALKMARDGKICIELTPRNLDNCVWFTEYYEENLCAMFETMSEIRDDNCPCTSGEHFLNVQMFRSRYIDLSGNFEKYRTQGMLPRAGLQLARTLRGRVHSSGGGCHNRTGMSG